MLKNLFKLRNLFQKSFVHYFSLFVLINAYINDNGCLLFFGEAKKTPNVTNKNIKHLIEKIHS